MNEGTPLTDDLDALISQYRSENIRLNWVIHHFENLPFITRLKFLLMPKRVFRGK